MRPAELASGVLNAGGGLATRRDLRAVVGQRWLRRAVRAGLLREVVPGVFATPDLPLDLETRLRSAVLFGGADAALSHTTALWMWGLVKEPPTAPFHVSVPRVAPPSDREVQMHERRPGPVESVQKLPVVGVREALVGSCSLEDLDWLRFPAMQAVQNGLVTAAELGDPAGVPRPRRTWMRTLAEEAAAGAESGGEAKYWRLLEESHLPTPVLQVELDTHQGLKRVDAYWEPQRLAAEIDSWEFHGDKVARREDSKRQNALHARGEVVIRFWIPDVMNDPTYVLTDTEANLRARGWRG
jgi:very-short-patch-repair endonuclease